MYERHWNGQLYDNNVKVMQQVGACMVNQCIPGQKHQNGTLHLLWGFVLIPAKCSAQIIPSAFARGDTSRRHE
eukprot:721234-Amphidinium_carterae.1